MSQTVADTLPDARIGFLGAGRVGETLARAFDRAGLQVSAVHSRQSQRAAALHGGVPSARVVLNAQDVADCCSHVFLTVSDDAIAPVCDALHWRIGQAVIHCSGATEVAALAAARKDGAAIGGFHPMQMFANPAVALQGLSGCTVGVEADGTLHDDLVALAERIGCRPFTLPPGTRALYHASAYYVGPFLIALLQEGTKLWEQFGVPEREALQALLPLLHGTVDAVRDGGLANGMGGCIARGDIGTVVRHLNALDAHSPEAGALYRQLALRNIPLGVTRGTLTPDRAQEIERRLRTPQAS